MPSEPITSHRETTTEKRAEVWAWYKVGKTYSEICSIGFSERSRHSIGCLWNSNIRIGEDCKVLAHHRKMHPTYWEKLIWSNGDGYGLRVCDTASAGKVGALICGENTNPLARYAMMAQGEQVHVASFPPAWPTKRKGGYQNRTANAVRSAAHSFEAKQLHDVVGGYQRYDIFRSRGNAMSQWNGDEEHLLLRSLSYGL